MLRVADHPHPVDRRRVPAGRRSNGDVGISRVCTAYSAEPGRQPASHPKAWMALSLNVAPSDSVTL